MENVPVPLAVEIWREYQKKFYGTIATNKKELDDWRAKREGNGQLNGNDLTYFKIREERLQAMVDYENATNELINALTDSIDSLRNQNRRLKSDIEDNLVRDLRAEIRAARQRNILWGATDPTREKIRKQSLLIAKNHQPDLF